MAQPSPQQPPQYAGQPRPFSPANGTVNGISSPITTQQYGQQPPPKRQKLSPNPTSQPPSPYVTSPYTASPTTSNTASPMFSNVQLPAGAYNTPYGNGHANGQPLPPQSHQPQPQYHSPAPQPHPNHIPMQQNNYSNFPPPVQTPGAMGPPLKPLEKPKEDSDNLDVLAGTGVNLQEEEQYMFQVNGSFGSGFQSSQSTNGSGPSFTQFPPGNEASFYGAGPANAAAERPDGLSEAEYKERLAQKAWADAAHNLAVSQGSEFNNPFLSTNRLHQKMDDMSQKHGLRLNRVDRNMMGQFAQPRDFHGTRQTVGLQQATGPGMMMMNVHGNFVPNDAMLSDQVALLSLACKYRLRTLLEDATKIARGRQTGSHGIVPADWADVAVESHLAMASTVPEGEVRAGWESAVSPHSNHHTAARSKEITPPAYLNGSKTPSGKLQASNEVVLALRNAAAKERDLEERRLKKRQNRTNGDVSKPVASVPGTPGSVAPDPTEKAPSKKELKKKAETKASEAATHAAANTTLAQFSGGASKGLFGKKKAYSWMNKGAGSGASTPGRLNSGGISLTPGGPVEPPVQARLTADPARRIGQWREDQQKGKGLQLRDWVAALESDGHAKRSLQKAYLFLDQSEPK